MLIQVLWKCMLKYLLNSGPSYLCINICFNIYSTNKDTWSMYPSLEHVTHLLHLWIIFNFTLLLFLENFVITTERWPWTHKIARILQQLLRLKILRTMPHSLIYLQVQGIFRQRTKWNNGTYHNSTTFNFFETLLSLYILKVTPLPSTPRTGFPRSWGSCTSWLRKIYSTFIFEKILLILHTQ